MNRARVAPSPDRRRCVRGRRLLRSRAGAPAATAAAHPPATPTPGPAPALPAPALRTRSPQAVLADVVQATGGAAAWNAHKTAHFKIETVFQGMGMGGTGDRFATRENKSMSVTEMTGLGTIREGTNGKVFWSQDPLQGLRMLDGRRERAGAHRGLLESRDAGRRAVREAGGRDRAGPGRKAARMRDRDAQGRGPDPQLLRPRDPPSSLTDGNPRNPARRRAFSAIMRDWRSVGGIKIAFEAETQVGPLTLVVPDQERHLRRAGGRQDLRAADGQVRREARCHAR